MHEKLKRAQKIAIANKHKKKGRQDKKNRKNSERQGGTSHVANSPHA